LDLNKIIMYCVLLALYVALHKLAIFKSPSHLL
jgi:hypothetical protein